MNQAVGLKPEITEILACAVQLLPEAVLLTEIEAGLEKIIFVNQAFERLSGFTRDELAGQDLAMLYPPESRNLHCQSLPSCGAQAASESVLHRKDGTPFQARITTSHWRQQERWYSVQVHADITQQKEIENRFLLAQKREATGHLVSGLAHDFNNLLTAILVYSGLMTPKLKDNPQLERYLAEIRAAAENGAQLVAELMNLGRQDAAQPMLADLGELILQTSDLLKRVLGEDIRFSTAIEPNLHKVKLQEGRIQQVLLNLGINAKDAMPKGGELLIRISNHRTSSAETELEPGSYVLVEVKDSGTGMDSETCGNIFKPFFSTKGRGKGTGLGLFTARTIVEHYHGRIFVESEPGKGATFKIFLPAADSAAPAIGAKAAKNRTEEVLNTPQQ
jgi:two-component system, cell cycle sensor histidine kinase and response regulator CckA